MARHFLLILLVAGQAYTKDPFFGEFVEKAQAPKRDCRSVFSALGKIFYSTPNRRAVTWALSGGAVMASAVASTFFLMEVQWVDAQRSRKSFERAAAQPWTEKTIEEYAENIAKLELEALEKNHIYRRHYRHPEILVFEMKKFADIWHSRRGEEVLKNKKSLMEFLEIRKLSIVRMVQEKNGAPLDVQMGYGVFYEPTSNVKDKELFLLRADAQRLLPLPAYSSDRPAEYRALMAGVLATLEKAALDHVEGQWDAQWGEMGRRTRQQFSMKAAEQQKKLVTDFIAKHFDQQYGGVPVSESDRARESLLSVLEKALAQSKPGQTVAECLKENGVALFSLKTNELFELLYREEVLSP
jgi:hypothetical protein